MRPISLSSFFYGSSNNEKERKEKKNSKLLNLYTTHAYVHTSNRFQSKFIKILSLDDFFCMLKLRWLHARWNSYNYHEYAIWSSEHHIQKLKEMMMMMKKKTFSVISPMIYFMEEKNNFLAKKSLNLWNQYRSIMKEYVYFYVMLCMCICSCGLFLHCK